MMLQTYEAVLEANGHLRFLEAAPIFGRASHRVLVTFTDEELPTDTALCGALLSEAALTNDWSNAEEDAAWEHLQVCK